MGGASTTALALAGAEGLGGYPAGAQKLHRLFPAAMTHRPASFLPSGALLLATLTALPLHAQLVAFEPFSDYSAGAQVESGANGVPGTGLDGGAGWGGPYEVNNAIKSLIRIENRSSSQVNYTNGGITLRGGNRALRFYDSAESVAAYALARPLGTVFQAAAGQTLWFSVLFRCSNASPLADQDFFQIGFDDNPDAFSGTPRVSFGCNTIRTTDFPAPFRFFVRSTAEPNASAFADGPDIAAATTYLLVARVQPHAGEYDTVSLFVNPADPDAPGSPAAEVSAPSGLASLSHFFIRTRYLDVGDAYVLDEWHVGRDYGSVVQSLNGALRTLPAPTPDAALELRWPVSLAGVGLETTPSLAPESWSEIPGPFPVQGAERMYLVPRASGVQQGFYRLKR